MTLCKCQIIFVPCRKCQKFTNHQILKSVKSRGLACKYERAYNICHISAAIQYIDNVSVLKRGHLGLPKTEKDRKKYRVNWTFLPRRYFPIFTECIGIFDPLAFLLNISLDATGAIILQITTDKCDLLQMQEKKILGGLGGKYLSLLINHKKRVMNEYLAEDI